MQEKVAFFKEAVKNFKTSGTIIPSSRFLVKRILSNIDFTNSKLIVEFGSGNGIITKQILKKIEPSTTLVCFEINKVFYNELKKINHKQLIVLNTSAENIQQEIEKFGFKKVDNFISSLPLTMLPKELSQAIIENSYKVLEEKGRFVQFQYSTQFLKQFKAVFNRKVKLDFEPLNIPPAFLYLCEK
ncbi:MAG: ribosomal RNA adenine dimethylase [Lutibacter sp.]|nr:MAG: ribosomal RNA adenine dimethylase [Lutibacter sp.]